MIAFSISFISSLLLMHWAIQNKKGNTKWLLHILAIIPPIFLLTFRSEECGTDTTNYTRMFNSVGTDSWRAYFLATRMETLFALLMFSIKRLGLSIEYLFCVSGCLTIIPVYVGCMKLRKKGINPVYPMSLFYLFFYQYSFNIVRQSIAMSLIFLAAIYLIDNKYKHSLFWGIAAILFHTVSMVYLLVHFAFVFKKKKLFYTLASIALLSIVGLNLMQEYYVAEIEYFQSTFLDKGETTVQSSYLMEMILNLLVVAFIGNKDSYNLRRFFILVSGFTVFTIAISSIAPYIFRIATCIDVLSLIYVSLALKDANKREYYALYSLFAFFFWWFVFIYNGSGRSYPYILSSSFTFF